jgi:RimJ/RimL family protein N-acetyltransferase
MTRLIRHFISEYPLACKAHARVIFAVELAGNVVGMVGTQNKKEVGNEIELCYFISREEEGKGYISEAAKAAARWALQNLGPDYLIAIVEPENRPSQRVVEKCGFERIETRMILNSGESEEKPFYYYRLYNA